VEPHVWEKTKDEAIASWNTRTPDTSIEALTEKLNEANEVIAKQGALLADAYGAYLDWDEVLKDRADHECKAKLAKAVEALREIASEASVTVHTHNKGGINYTRMYEDWRKLAVKRIDKARDTLAEIEGGKG
jgi:methionine synthase II (cobalamin-independent)